MSNDQHLQSYIGIQMEANAGSAVGVSPTITAFGSTEDSVLVKSLTRGCYSPTALPLHDLTELTRRLNEFLLPYYPDEQERSMMFREICAEALAYVAQAHARTAQKLDEGN